MAKAKFERTKPHVNVATIGPKLQAMGFTAAAARELANGSLPSFPGDRTLLVHRFIQLVDKIDGQMTWLAPDHR